jgi:uncharacterized phage-associated protein
MTTAQEIATYIIHEFQIREDLITNLKLQKLLYYVQGWYLGLNKKPLFEEDFEAWVHGPVVPEIYQTYKEYRWNPIVIETNKPNINPQIEKHITDVLDEYGIETGWALERRTHLEQPWISARGCLLPTEECTSVITKDSMMEFFQELAALDRIFHLSL